METTLTPSARLYELRIDNQLTQKELAAQIRCCTSFVSRIETGERLPGRKTAKLIEQLTSRLGNPIRVADWDDDAFETED